MLGWHAILEMYIDWWLIFSYRVWKKIKVRVLLFLNWQAFKGFLEKFSVCRWAMWTRAMRRQSYVLHNIHRESIWTLHQVPGYLSISLVAIDQNQIPALRTKSPEQNLHCKRNQEPIIFHKLFCNVHDPDQNKVVREEEDEMLKWNLQYHHEDNHFQNIFGSHRRSLALAFCHMQ